MANERDYQPRTQTPDPGAAPLALAHPPQAPVVQIGEAYHDLTRGLDSVADSYRKSQEEEARAWSSNVLASTRLEWSQTLQDRQENAEPNAPGFTQDFVRDFNAYADEALKKAPTGRAKLYLQQRLNAVMVEYAEKAKTFEAQARLDYRSDQFGNAIDNSSKLMNTDPDQYQSVLAERVAEIDGSSMPPIKKSALRQKAIDGISKAAVWSQIQKSPSGFLASIGFYGTPDEATGKTRPFNGDLKGRTGNDAFDILPFEIRTHMFETAIRLKSQNDSDLDRRAKEVRKGLEEDAEKNLWAAHADGKLTRDMIDRAAPVLSGEKYHAFLKAIERGGESQKSDPSVFRDIQRKMSDGDYKGAEKLAYQAHTAGNLSNGDLRSEVERARTLARQEGPKTPYERQRKWLSDSMDPGPMVQDPVGRGRMADALRDFDDWYQSAGAEKLPDKDVQARAVELRNSYKLVNLSDTLVGLPQPRTGVISRNVGDTARIMKDIAEVGHKIQTKFDSKAMTQDDYEKEMAIVNRWRKAIVK